MYVHYSITFKCRDSFICQHVVINCTTNIKIMRFREKYLKKILKY